jgi:hypothetical protein
VQALEEDVELCHVVGLETPTQPLVELPSGPGQGHEEVLALVGETDHLRTPVARLPRADDEPPLLHPDEVMGEGRTADPDVVGDLLLARGRARLERQQDHPDRP